LDEDDLLDPNEREYDLISPEQTLIPFSVILPTSTSSFPLCNRLPVSPTTTIADCLSILHRELGLPVSTLDLVGPASRSEGSKRSTHTRGDTAIRWSVRAESSGEKLDTDQRLLKIVQGDPGVTIHVSIDEEWLFELTPGHSTPNVPSEADTNEAKDSHEDEEGGEGDDKEDTLKAQAKAQIETPRKRTAILMGKDTPTSPQSPGQARLSGLFHAWVDTNQHHAPPPTMIGGRGGAASLAEQLGHVGPSGQGGDSPERDSNGPVSILSCRLRAKS